jgi:hypothetical protein
MDSTAIQSQLDANRRSVSFDSYDVTVRQLYDMISEDIIDVTLNIKNTSSGIRKDNLS